MFISTIRTLTVISLMAIGCSKQIEQPAPVPYTYDIHFKITDSAGNNLLNGVHENDISNYIVISSPDGKIDASGVYIKEYGGERFLNIKTNSLRGDFLKTLEYSLTSPLIGSEKSRLIVTTWDVEKNSAVLKEVLIDSKKITPAQHQGSALFYYLMLVH